MAYLEKLQIESSRVYFVGDIHGQYIPLLNALSESGFDPKSGDVLVSVGDLIDRGPQSLQVLELLDNHWFKAVMGNHEELLINGLAAMEGRRPSSDIQNWQLFNGGEWYNESPVVKRRVAELLPKIKALPYAIQVETELGSIGVIHADAPEHVWPDATSFSSAEFRKKAIWDRNNGLRAQALAMREQVEQTNLESHRVVGIDRMIVGHTMMPNNKPILIENTLYLDVGAGRGDQPYVIRGDQVFKMECFVNE